ncbi:uncharacterized protein LOC107709713 [Sinocyclocheilus rhinocerous]|uniref:uncharacterized protein LOC107709713 n=1 Tax=Sinocyclocheilus rhinocerous TaxID=307959 RepID=UPI0007B7EEC8|nr:PREDICTED: uncharacterized protein LOC107709713 [Sinocyclocheilus rhinocerous]
MSMSRACCAVMVPFEDVLSQVRKALQVSPSLLHELLRELHEANVFSTQYYQSLYKDGEDGEQHLRDVFYNDPEDLARRLSLPIWQNWDISQGILDSVLSKEEDMVPSYAESQDIVPDPMSELLPDNVILEYLDSLEEFIEEDFDPKFFDNFSVDTDTTCTPIPEDASFPDEVQSRKRKVDATSNKTRRSKRNKKATAWPESPSNGRPPNITPESSFHLSSNPFQHVLRIPFSPPLLPPSGGSPLQFIQTIGPYTAPLIGTVVPTGPTYVIVSAVSPQCVSPGTQIIPLSPADGTVAPPELTGSVLPVGSSSDSACQGLPPVSVDTLSPTKDLTQSDYSLKGLLFDLSMFPRCKDSDSVFKHILSCPDEVLIIFDSFDHIKDFEGLLQSPAKSHTNTKYTIKQLFSGLFQKEILSGCTLLIATRPKDVLNQVLRKMDSLLELCGFSPEDIELYTSKYFGDASLQESALKQIKNHRYISSLCSNPLLCWTTCFLLEHQDSCNDDLPSTLTDLYQRVTSKHLQLASLENSSLCKNRKQLDIPQLCLNH